MAEPRTFHVVTFTVGVTDLADARALCATLDALADPPSRVVRAVHCDSYTGAWADKLIDVAIEAMRAEIRAQTAALLGGAPPPSPS